MAPESCQLFLQMTRPDENFGVDQNIITSKVDVYGFALVVMYFNKGYHILQRVITNGRTYEDIPPVQVKDLQTKLMLESAKNPNLVACDIQGIADSEMRHLLEKMTAFSICDRCDAKTSLGIVDGFDKKEVKQMVTKNGPVSNTTRQKAAQASHDTDFNSTNGSMDNLQIQNEVPNCVPIMEEAEMQEGCRQPPDRNTWNTMLVEGTEPDQYTDDKPRDWKHGLQQEGVEYVAAIPLVSELVHKESHHIKNTTIVKVRQLLKNRLNPAAVKKFKANKTIPIKSKSRKEAKLFQQRNLSTNQDKNQEIPMERGDGWPSLEIAQGANMVPVAEPAEGALTALNDSPSTDQRSAWGTQKDQTAISQGNIPDFSLLL